MTQTNYSYERRMFIFLAVLAAAAAIGLQGWRTLLNNFAVEAAGTDGFGMGVIQSVREIPGFLALLVVYLLMVIREHKLAALSIAILGAGIAVAGFFPSTMGLIFTTLIMSFGFHYFETCNQSLTLQSFSLTQAPIIAGRLRAIASAGNLVAGGFVFVAAYFLDYTALFAVIGIAVLAVGAAAYLTAPHPDNALPQNKGMVFRWRYWLFYTLTMLAGARRQIFIAFSVFLLVEHFGFSVQDVTLLFILNNVINWFASPFIGRAIAKYGERAVLSVEYGGLIAVFIVYGTTDSPLVAGCMYVIDHLLFNCSIAIRTFFQKIADPADIAPSMAVGFTINHIAAVIIPVIGGALWLTDPAVVFFGGAGLAAMSLAFVQLIRTTPQ